MARHRPSASSAQQPPAQAGRHDVPAIFDAFVSDICLPHAKLRKRSWDVDERIARQHLSPTFGDRRLAGIQHHEVEIWLYRLDQRLLTVPLSKSGRPRHILLPEEAIKVLRALPRTSGNPPSGGISFAHGRSRPCER